MPPVISIRNLVKTYVVGEVEVRALRGVSLDVQPRRVRRRHRAVGLGQVDADAHPRLPRSADVRAVHPRRPGRVADVEGPARRGPQQEDRLRLSGLQPAVAHDGARQRRAAAALRRRQDEDGRAAPAGDGGADGGRPGRARRSSSESAVRRPAAARGDRARARSPSRRSCWPTSRPATSTRARASRSWASSSG